MQRESPRSRRVRTSLLHGLVALAAALALAACGGGGGGGDDELPLPGGSGTGADGVPIFWRIYEWNVDAGAAHTLRQTAGGGFVMAGYQQPGFSGGTPQDLFVQKTDSLGVRQWARRIPWAGGGVARDVRQTADGGYIVAGTGGTSPASTIVLLKLNADGSTASG
jgi:hypothetical protein